jgi:DNA-binding NarL/FixJ family response regulator
MNAMIRVLVVDDHPAVRLGVLRLLEDEPDLDPQAFATGAEAIEVAAHRPFDVAVVDYQLSEGEDGLTVTRELLCLPAPPGVLVYSSYADAPLTALARVAGAGGVLNKITLGDELVRAIRDIARGGRSWPLLPERITFSLSRRLAPTDRRLFAMWIAGVQDADVLEASGLDARGLEQRRRAILETLGGPPGYPRLPWDDGDWPLSAGRSRRLRSHR